MPIDTNNNRQIKTPEPKQFGGALLLLFMVLVLLNLFLLQAPRYPTTAYSDFITQVETDKVARVEIGSERIRYVLQSEQVGEQPQQVFDTIPLTTDVELPKLLREHQVKFFVRPTSGMGWLQNILSWVIPPLIFFGIWFWLLNRTQGASPTALTIGKSKARIYSEGSTGVTFSDVAGVDEAKAELREIVDFLKNAGKYTRLGAKIPKGVLLVGHSGNGQNSIGSCSGG